MKVYLYIRSINHYLTKLIINTIHNSAAVLLTHMPESYAFSTIREMMNDTSNNFLLVCQKDYYSLCKSYAIFVKKILPAHYKVMETCGALDPKEGGLDPIFKRFFTTLLKRNVSIWFIDCKDIVHL